MLSRRLGPSISPCLAERTLVVPEVVLERIEARAVVLRYPYDVCGEMITCVTAGANQYIENLTGPLTEYASPGQGFCRTRLRPIQHSRHRDNVQKVCFSKRTGAVRLASEPRPLVTQISNIQWPPNARPSTIQTLSKRR